jgi:segregation and condensation protein A
VYKVNLENFEGPLDLLLFLIRRDEIDIYDIPISRLTHEYLEYISQLEEKNLAVAGEFLVMAAQLMLIKSRMLLPPLQDPESEQEISEDPRAELVQRLLEYKQFKEAAFKLHEKESLQREVFGRLGVADNLDSKSLNLDDEQNLDVNLFDLLKAFQRVLNEMPVEKFREIDREEVTVVQKINEILDLLEQRGDILFQQIFENSSSKVAVIVTFLAMLELAKMKTVQIRQSNIFGQIRIYRSSQYETDNLKTLRENENLADSEEL